MKTTSILSHSASWLFGLALVAIGILNLFLVHPLPGIAYLILSLLFFPPVNVLLKKSFGFTVPPAAKIIIGIVIVWFTLGIGDLAEMYGL